MTTLFRSVLLCLVLVPALCVAGKPAEVLPYRMMLQMQVTATPVDNAAFTPGKDAEPAPPFAGVLQTAPAPLHALPALTKSVVDGRDALVFPGLSLGVFTMGDTLVPVQRGAMLRSLERSS